MILQRLAEQYDRMKDVVRSGYSRQKISFCIVLKPDGSLNQFESLLEAEGKVKRPRSLDVPGQSKPSGSGLNPCLLWDNAEYLLGYTDKPDRKERALREFEESRKEHLKFESKINHPAYTAVCIFFRNWSPDICEKHPELEELASNFGVFRIAGEMKYVHELITLPQDGADAEDESITTISLVSGEPEVISRLHEPKIKGVAGAQTSGALLVSFNADAFTSYGKEQSYNAPVGETTVFKYTNALNQLLSSDRRFRIGDTTYVYWADRATPAVDIFASLIIGEPAVKEEEKPQEDQKRVEQARILLTQLRDGTQQTTLKPDDVPTKFFILGLSPNASRLSVRMWVEADASEILRRLSQHVEDFKLLSDDDVPPPIWRVVLATGRAESDPKGRFKSYDSDSVSPKLAGDLTRSVLSGVNYPQSLLAAMVRRIHSDGHIRFERVCAIKACLVRNTRRTSNPLEKLMKLDQFDQSNLDVAYRCGRLFAILEKAQNDSAGSELNSTIKDRYFSAASVTPALVFPRLFRLNGFHLNKLETGGKVYYERMIASVMTAPFEFPRQLPLLDQGKFIVGYFQQRQDLYTKKEKA
ncbi:MAG: type I-C CRISPR-associated protein Cas8c/Csd1 [Acidobacteriaceae bacterium]|nr:type I-C CRISPR-associated protein Cas8c/Csd1 [Acidobacteriaceae bacterium]